MPYKIILFVLLGAVYVNTTETNELCPCNEIEVKDEALFWTLMKKLSVDIPEDEKDIYTVLAGELSPMIDCNCDENNRKKRKTLEEPEAVPVSLENVRETKSKRHVDISCPLGLVRFGIRCVEEDYFYDEN